MNIREKIHLWLKSKGLALYRSRGFDRAEARYILDSTKGGSCEIQIGDVKLETPPLGGRLTTHLRSIFVDRVYDFSPRTSKPVCVDLGANVGAASCFWLNRFPDAFVHSFEPDPELYRYLELNCMRIDSGRVTLRNAAVFDKAGEALFEPDGSTAGKVVKGVSATTIQVPGFTIEEILEPHESVEVLKMDIEGAEWGILAARPTILRKCRNLFIEFHVCEENRDLAGAFSFLVDQGFNLVAMDAPMTAAPFREDHSGRFCINAYFGNPGL